MADVGGLIKTGTLQTDHVCYTGCHESSPTPSPHTLRPSYCSPKQVWRTSVNAVADRYPMEWKLLKIFQCTPSSTLFIQCGLSCLRSRGGRCGFHADLVFLGNRSHLGLLCLACVQGLTRYDSWFPMRLLIIFYFDLNYSHIRTCRNAFVTTCLKFSKCSLWKQ